MPTKNPSYISLSPKDFIAACGGGYKGIKKEDGKGFYESTNWKGEPELVFEGIEVKGDIHIHGQKNLPHLILINCKTQDFWIENSTTGEFSIENSTTGNFAIRKSTTGYFRIENSTTGNFWIQERSATKNFKIENSITGEFKIENSTTGNFNIINSTTENFWIRNSTPENFWIENSTTSSFTIENSTTEGFRIRNSTTGNFWIENSTTGEFRIQENSTTEGFRIRNSTTEEFRIRNSTTEKFWIQENSITGMFWIQEKSITGDFRIQKNSTTGDFRIQKNSTTGMFWIQENSITGDFRIQENSITGDFRIQENSTTGEFRIIKNSKTGKFWIQKNSSMGYFRIRKSTTGYFRINDSTMGDFRIDDSTMGDIFIGSSSSVRALSLSNIQCPLVQVKEGSYLETLDLGQISETAIALENCQIKTLSLNQSIWDAKAVVQMGNCAIQRIEMRGFVNLGLLIMSGLKPLQAYSQFKMDEKNNPIRDKDGKYEMENVENAKTCFSLIDSDLGKSSFINCELTRFDNFEFYNSKVLSLFLAESPMPKDIKLPESPIAKWAEEIPEDEGGNGEKKREKGEEAKLEEQRRLAFGQFKQVYAAQGDQVRAREFLALEMDSYRSQLRKDKNLWSWRAWQNWQNQQERLALWANKHSSNHGNNWLKAAILTMVLAGISFILYCLFLGYGIGTDFKTFGVLLSYSLEYINPVHKTNFIDLEKVPPANKGLPNLARFWDYLNRIFVAYFVYQTVQAFRRFGQTTRRF